MTSYSTRSGPPPGREGLSREEIAGLYPPLRTLRLSALPWRFWRQAHCDHDWQPWSLHSAASGIELSTKDICRHCGAERF